MPDSTPPTSKRRPAARTVRAWRRGRTVVLAVAGLPLFQGLICFPDPVGALNFEIQNLLNSIIFTVVNTLVRNLFNL
ncbi:MAG: hypothetical protein L6Q92_12970 [Phycisphaerae bacterium]|nr:hypothetical protein [Phycisphaerae bacterium]